MPSVIFDTNILLRIVLPSQHDPLADALWQWCADQGVDVVIPSQAVSEAMATVRSYVFRGPLTAPDGDTTFDRLRGLVASMQIETVQLGAWEVAKRLNRPDTYDSEFYALAEQSGAEFWTADDRFVNAMGQRRPAWVRRLADFEPVS